MKFNAAECTTCSIIKNQKKIIEQQQRIIDSLTEQNRRLLSYRSRKIDPEEIPMSLN